MAGPAPASAIPAGNATLTAYRIPGRRYLKIEPASSNRKWMDVTTQGWANRCLPLKIANQSGWVILNDREFRAVWGGTPGLDSVKFLTQDGRSASAESMFGHGVVTWSIPYIFRTLPGYNLYVRGPSNASKNFIVPFDAVVETDWLPYPFTMNWRFTQPLKTVKFEKDEPICLLMPVKRGELENVIPEIRNLESDPRLLEGYTKWHESREAAQEIAVRAARAKTLQTPQERAADLAAAPKQGYYIRGEGYLGERPEAELAQRDQIVRHQTKLNLATFTDAEPANNPDPLQFEETKAHQKSLWRRMLGV